MRNHHNHESSLEIKSQASWLGTKGKDIYLVRCHFRQVIPLWLTKSKQPYSFVPVSLRVTSRPNLSVACESQPAHSVLCATVCVSLSRQGGSFGTTLPSRANAYRAPISTVLKTCPNSAVSICSVWKDSCHHLWPKKVQSSRVKLCRTECYRVLCSRSVSSPASYFLINWIFNSSTPKQVFLYFMTELAVQIMPEETGV